MIKFSVRIALATCLFLWLNAYALAEGTREVMPTVASKGQLCLNKYRNPFALYDAAPEFRLNISIANTSEKIRFGFGEILSDNGHDLLFRIKDAAGNIVLPEAAVPVSGPGYINTYSEALAGPFPLNGGYNYLEFQPASTGDFYIEFSYSGSVTDQNRRYLAFFDITVIKPDGNPVNGRLWSEAWQFWSGGDSYSPYERFYGKMMILSNDSIVTQVDCNGFRGGSFSFSSNKTGCDNTGVAMADRKSRAGFHTYPQYKVFINNPDSTLFPTPKAASGISSPILVNADCNGSVDFGIKVEKDCAIKLSIDINPNPGADAEDVQIIENLLAHPGGSGYNMVHWDGNDNLGHPVPNAKALTFSVTNLSGLTNLPIFDIENNDYGYIVKQIRPGAGTPLNIYWDDSQLAGGTSNTTTGCSSSGGCHAWSSDFGNNNTINSWWYVSGTQLTSIPLITKRKPGEPVISGNPLHCMGGGSLNFEVIPQPGDMGYTWSYSGQGVGIVNHGATSTLTFGAGATAGLLAVSAENSSCGVGPQSTLDIVFEPLPVVRLDAYADICYTSPGIRISGGNPAGGTYFFEGVATDSIFPYKMNEGKYQVVYTYTEPLAGCTNSDTAMLKLISDPSCEGTVFFPNAFRPGSPSSNNSFKPVVQNIYSFSMKIFSRWGQLLYTTTDVNQGWDGTLNGIDCPMGTYIFEAIYAPSLRNEGSKTSRGLFSLLR